MLASSIECLTGSLQTTNEPTTVRHTELIETKKNSSEQYISQLVLLHALINCVKTEITHAEYPSADRNDVFDDISHLDKSFCRQVHRIVNIECT